MLLLAKRGPQNLAATLVRSDKVVEALFARLRILEVWRAILGSHLNSLYPRLSMLYLRTRTQSGTRVVGWWSRLDYLSFCFGS